MFAPEKRGANMPPFALNTRIYSCILIQNNIAAPDGTPYRWRGRYNEDTDLSLRVLKDGWCTVLFYAFLAGKMPTMTMKGGNSDELYAAEDGRYQMALSLVRQHPDVTTITRKWGRWQHQVDYRPFKNNRLIKRPGAIIPAGADEYGMVLAGPGRGAGTGVPPAGGGEKPRGRKARHRPCGSTPPSGATRRGRCASGATRSATLPTR